MTLSYFITFALLVVPAWSFSAGAPKQACVDMIPQHHVDPQKIPAPYTISTTKSQLRGGDSVDITIKGNLPKDTIKGFMVQGRVNDKPVGHFDVPANDKFGQATTCDKDGDTLTHKKIEGTGPNSLTYTWIAPKDHTGNVVFKATIALNGGVFWVGELSSPLALS